jgi:hypothetical protein
VEGVIRLRFRPINGEGGVAAEPAVGSNLSTCCHCHKSEIDWQNRFAFILPEGQYYAETFFYYYVKIAD